MFTHVGRISAVILAATLGASALSVVPAAADDSTSSQPVSTVFAFGHTDSPKAFWDDSAKNLTLKATQAQREIPLEQATHWLHRAYSGAGQQEQFYYMSVPDDPRYSFLGKPGDLLYTGFAENSVGSQNPALWIGFGADAGIPVEQFRDQSFMLELTDFAGPGDMEIFRRGSGDENTSIARYLSSKDPHYRATMLTAGTHSHLVTTFTKPGRYQAKYRTAYRGTDGRYVYSAEQIMTWQVGGADPAGRTIDDVANAWNTSNTGSPAGGQPTFSAGPLSGSEPLTHFTFNTGNPADSGVAVLTIDGYEFTQLPVQRGVAQFDDMVGSQPAQFAVLYLPDAGSATAKWLSEPLTVTTGDPLQTVSTMGQQFPQATPRSMKVEFKDRQATSNQVTLSSVDTGDALAITVTPADPGMDVDVVGGFGANLKRALVECPISFHAAAGARTFNIDPEFLEYCEGAPHFQVIPAPETSGVSSVTFDGTAQDSTFQFTGAFPTSPTGTSVEDNTAELSHHDENTESSTPAQTAPSTTSPNPSSNDDDDGDVPTGGKFTQQDGGLAWTDPGDIFAHDFSDLFTTGKDTEDTHNTEVTESAQGGTETGNATTNPTLDTQPAAEGNATQNPAEASSNAPLVTSDGEIILATPVTISEGHVDVGPMWLKNNTLAMAVKDDSRQHEKKTVLRDPAAVTLAAEVGPYQRSARVFGDASLNFLGQMGTPLYVLPLTQVTGLVWPGFSTEHLPSDIFPSGGTISVKAQSMPEGGHAWGFTTDMSGKLQKLHVDGSAVGKESFISGQGTHLHLNWVFTKPGTYTFQVAAQAKTADGKQVTSPASVMTLRVVDPDAPAQGADGAHSGSGENGDGTPATGSQSGDGAQPPAGSENTDNNTDTGATNGANPTNTQDGTDDTTDTGSPASGGGVTAPGAPSGALGGLTTAGGGATGAEQCLPTEVKKEIPASEAKSSAGGSYTIPANTHVHPNWVFTQAGTYKVTIRQSAQKDGKTLSGYSTLTFNVGGQGNANEGHFDIGAKIEGGKLVPSIKDDRKQPAQWVQPESLTFGLGDKAQVKAPSGIEFIAAAGQTIWMIGSTQMAGVPWVGANTMHESLGGNTPVTWTLESVQGPGKLAVFTSGNFGQAVGTRWFDSGSMSNAGGKVTQENGKYYRTEWVGKTASGADCQLTPEQLAAAQGGGIGASNLAHTGAQSTSVVVTAAVLFALGAVGAVALRRRR